MSSIGDALGLGKARGSARSEGTESACQGKPGGARGIGDQDDYTDQPSFWAETTSPLRLCESHRLSPFMGKLTYVVICGENSVGRGVMRDLSETNVEQSATRQI